MTLLRLAGWLCLLVLALPARGLAQHSPVRLPDPAQALSSVSPGSASLTLASARLACPECACERARSDLLMVQREYREVHRKTSTRGPRLMITLGFAGAAGTAVMTWLASMIPPASGHDAAAKARAERERCRALITAGLMVTIPLTIGFSGVHWLKNREREVAPYLARDAELRLAVGEARQNRRAQCQRTREPGQP